MPTVDLFADPIQSGRQQLGPATWLLRGFAQPWMDTLLTELRLIEAAAPFRHMLTPGGLRMSVAQDKDECDFSAPIVSISLGLPAVFQFGGMRRADKPERVALLHGDVLVWGGEDRLRYHGVLALKDGQHPLLGAQRINLTFRRAG
jgi:alkylated DNA repair dioxygenase AlkB